MLSIIKCSTLYTEKVKIGFFKLTVFVQFGAAGKSILLIWQLFWGRHVGLAAAQHCVSSEWGYRSIIGLECFVTAKLQTTQLV